MEVFLEPSDAAREVGVVAATIKAAADAGKLPVAAVTRRGVRLFTAAAVEKFRQERARKKGL